MYLLGWFVFDPRSRNETLTINRPASRNRNPPQQVFLTSFLRGIVAFENTWWTVAWTRGWGFAHGDPSRNRPGRRTPLIGGGMMAAGPTGPVWRDDGMLGRPVGGAGGRGADGQARN